MSHGYQWTCWSATLTLILACSSGSPAESNGGTGGASSQGGVSGSAGQTVATGGAGRTGGTAGGTTAGGRNGGTGVSTGGNASGGGAGVQAGGTAGVQTGGTAGAFGGGGKSTGGAGGTGVGGTGGGAVGGAGGTGGSGSFPKPPAQAYYYVAPTGSDDSPGTESAPFRTVAKARDAVRTVNSKMTGDIYVYLRGGNHSVTSTITLGVQDSGTNGYRVYYAAYPGETPVLNGATKVTGWTQHSGNVYKAPLNRTTKLRNLYVNDLRASMTSKKVTSKGGYGTHAVTTSQGSWAWKSGSGSDGVKYSLTDVPAISSNKDDLEIVNGTTWNENIVCTRDVITTSDNNRALLLQQPYGVIAQLPGWNSGFGTGGTHTIFNAFEFMNGAGQFYFDKTTGTLYYYRRANEDMATADVEAPVAEKLLDIAGTSSSNRVKNITFKGITFANTDYNLYEVANSRGKATVQGATVYVAYGDGDWHSSKYQIVDTLPAMINMNNADGISFVDNVIKHSGSEGIAMINDVINSNVIGNYITDIAGSGITVGHPQHVYLGDGGTHAKYPAGVEGICTKDTITNNFIYNVSTLPGFGGHAGVTAFFVNGLSITYNHIHTTAYNGINLGWGWRNFVDSTTCKDNTISYNRFNATLNRLHDSGAIYTLGQMPGTTINQNYVKGIPPATSGPTYGLHNDEGSAYITENDNVLDIDPGVKYTINAEEYGDKHDLTILRTYATVSKMGITPRDSKIDRPVAVPDNVWPLEQYKFCLASGVQADYRSIVPSTLVSIADYVFPASCAPPRGTTSLPIRSNGDASAMVWLAPAGTTTFAAGATMTKAAGDATSIAVPTTPGNYKLFIVDGQGKKIGESSALLRVSGT